MTIDLTIPEGGQHRVTIIRRLDRTGLAVAFFFVDVCHQSEIKDMTELLKDNGFMNHGAFGIFNERLVALDTQIEGTADIEEVAAILFHLASYADKYKGKMSWKGFGDKKPPGPIGKMMSKPSDYPD